MHKEKILKAIWKFAKTKELYTIKTLLKNKYPRIYQWILEQTTFLDKYDKVKNGKHSLSIFERIYCIEHNLSDRPIC